MTHIILDIALIAYSAFWTFALIVFMLPNTKLHQYLKKLYLVYRKNFDRSDLVKENLKKLSNLKQQPGEKTYYIQGTKVHAKNYNAAMAKYQKVLQLKVEYDQIHY